MDCYILLDHHRFNNLNRLITPDFQCPYSECLAYTGKQTGRLYIIFKCVCDWNRYGERVLKWMKKQSIQCENKEIYRYYHTNSDSPREFENSIYKRSYRTVEDKDFIQEIEDDLGLTEAFEKFSMSL